MSGSRSENGIQWISLWRILAFILLATIVYFGRKILLGLFLAVVISSGLEFIVTFFERKGVPRVISVTAIFFVSAMILLLAVYTVIPLLIVDVNTAFVTFAKLSEKSWWGPLVSLEATESFNSFLTRFSQRVFSGGSPLATFSDIIGGIGMIVSIVVSAFYLSLTRDGIERFIRSVFPEKFEDVVLKVYSRSVHKVGIWFRTQILLSLIVSTMVFITLALLDVRYSFIIALMTMVLEMVPYIGPLISGSIAVFAAFLTSPTLAIYTLIAFVGIQEIENSLLVPLLVGRNTGLHPVVVIISLLIGFEAGGIMGMIVSVPLAVVLQEVIEEWSGRKKLSVSRAEA